MGDKDDFRHLDAAGQAASLVVARPQRLVYGVTAVAIALSWALLLAMAQRAADILPGQGPGSLLLQTLPDIPLPAFLRQLFALCLTPVGAGDAGATLFAALLAMWFLMAIAMMLPSAAPLVRTYCEIADTAAAKGEPAVHPLVLVGGYLTIWLAASAFFALATVAVWRLGLASGAAAPVTGIAGGAALFAAGLYQFSALKQACLRKCRNPFAILFGRWTVKPAGVFRLGVEQGLWCLGCCWALMLVMFAVGVMNIFWMALLAVFALVEKQTGGRLSTRTAGGILLVWAAALLVVSV